MPVIECETERARERLERAGIEIEAGNTDHERWRATHEGATAVAYEDTVVIQGEAGAGLVGLIRAESGRAHLYVDGASRGNPGPAAIGWVIVTDDGIVTEGNERIGKTTNNRAEYQALVRGLEVADSYGYGELEARSDSELIVKQVRGEWDVEDPDLREYRLQVRQLFQRFDEWSLSHVPREVNERADRLANQALDEG